MVTEPYASPTRNRLVTALRTAYPQARVIAWEPAGEVNVHEGLKLAAGRPLILCTGQPEARRLGALPGVARVVDKPFDQDVFVASVRTALANRD